MGCSKLLVESDCMEVVEALQQGGNFIGPAATISDECSFLCRSFIFVCPREANMAAHVIASIVVDTQTIVWTADPPDFLVDVLGDCRCTIFFPQINIIRLNSIPQKKTIHNISN